jgi:hypothetical protein
MVVRKYVDMVMGAWAFLKAVGFARGGIGPKNTEYIYLSAVDPTKLRRGVELLGAKLALTERKVTEQRARRAAEEEANALLACMDGCGYLAEERLGGYCSVCFERRYYGEILIPPWQLGRLGNAMPNVIFVSNIEEATPLPCVSGCGYFGLTFMGLCGSCWQLETGVRTERVKTKEVHDIAKCLAQISRLQFVCNLQDS